MFVLLPKTSSFPRKKRCTGVLLFESRCQCCLLFIFPFGAAFFFLPDYADDLDCERKRAKHTTNGKSFLWHLKRDATLNKIKNAFTQSTEEGAGKSFHVRFVDTNVRRGKMHFCSSPLSLQSSLEGRLGGHVEREDKWCFFSSQFVSFLSFRSFFRLRRSVCLCNHKVIFMSVSFCMREEEAKERRGNKLFEYLRHCESTFCLYF